MSKTIHITNRKEQTFDVIVSDDRYDEVMRYRWYIKPHTHGIYVARNMVQGGQMRSYYLHWQIMGKPPSGMCIDHRDGNGLNNTGENLRLCTKQQNCINRGAQRNNTSGYKGVSWNAQYQHWTAQGKIGGKLMVFGYYDNPYEAHLVYCNRMEAAHGEYFNPGNAPVPKLFDILSMFRQR